VTIEWVWFRHFKRSEVLLFRPPELFAVGPSARLLAISLGAGAARFFVYARLAIEVTLVGEMRYYNDHQQHRDHEPRQECSKAPPYVRLR
jgi:hypothetical protein